MSPMSPMSPLVVAFGLGMVAQTVAYTLQRDYSGVNFTDGFVFRTAADYPGTGDPTNGFVNYVGRDEAVEGGLFKMQDGQVYLGADSTKRVENAESAQGRDSLRLEATESFTGGLLIADIAHMPGGACGVWPAFWTFNFDEDPYGEVDIIEGTMHQEENIVSLHTCGECSFSSQSSTLTPGRENCDLGGHAQGCSDEAADNYDGCGNTGPQGSYGDPFNSAGGGVYATLFEESSLKIWYFSRQQIPSDIAAGTPDPATWPAPTSSFSGGSCNIGYYFKKQKIIINTTFCGSNIDQDVWEGDSTCAAAAADCRTFVAENPDAFTESYWLFNSIRLYQ